jgi:hypothetical protein
MSVAEASQADSLDGPRACKVALFALYTRANRYAKVAGSLPERDALFGHTSHPPRLEFRVP